MFVISQKAAEKFLESMEQIGETGLFLRAPRPGDCLQHGL